MPMSWRVSAQRVQEAARTCKGTPIGVGGMAGSARDVAASVEMAAAVWNKPEAPAVTAGASPLAGTLPLGLPCRGTLGGR